MTNQEYDERFAEVFTYTMTLCYLLEDFAEYSPHFIRNVKQSGKVFLKHLTTARDLYFGVKNKKIKVDEATEQEQMDMFENMKLVEKLTKSSLNLTEEQRTQIRNIVNKYEKQI